MFRRLLLDFLAALCGDTRLMKEKISFMNRRTRRKASRELVRLGYEEKGFMIEPKLKPLTRADIAANFRKAGGKVSSFARDLGGKVKSIMPGSPKKDEDKKSEKAKNWTGLEQLEERVLLSGTTGAELEGLEDVHSAETHQAMQTRQAEEANNPSAFEGVDALEFSNNNPQITPGLSVEGEAEVFFSNSADLFNAQSEGIVSSDTPSEQYAQEKLSLVIVDAGIDNFQDLVSDLPENSLVFILDAKKDGLEQISSILSDFSNVDSLHILSHGSEGEIRLGNSVLNQNNIDQYQETLSSWASSFASDADLLLYGCDVAGSEAGVAFVEDLASFLDVDVAASDDLTGAQGLNGDWDLEFASGLIEAQTLNSASFEGTLANVIAVSSTDDNTTVTGTAGEDQYVGTMNNVTLKGLGGDDTYKIYSTRGSKNVTIEDSAGTKDVLDLSGYKADMDIALGENGAFTVTSLEKGVFPTSTKIAESTKGIDIIKGSYGDDIYKWKDLLVNNGGAQHAYTIIEDDNAGEDTLDLSGAIPDNGEGLRFYIDSSSKITVTNLAETVTYLKDVEGIENLVGTSGNDVFVFQNKGVLKGTINGGAGEDYISFFKSSFLNYSPVLNLLGDSYGGKIKFDEAKGNISKINEGNDNGLFNVERFIGGASGDIITLKDDASYVAGSIDLNNYTDDSQWDRVIEGRGGGDFIQGANTDDVFYGGAANDTLYGGSGSDKLVGGGGADFLNGEEGNDLLLGSSVGGGSLGTLADDDSFYFKGEWGIDTIIDDIGDNILDFSDSKKSLEFYFNDLGTGLVHKQVIAYESDDVTTTTVNESLVNRVLYQSKNDTGEGDVAQINIARDSEALNKEYFFQFQDSWDDLIINNISEIGYVWLDFSQMNTTTDFDFTFFSDGSVEISNDLGDTIEVNHVSRIDLGKGTNTFKFAAGASFDGELIFTSGSTNVLDLSDFADSSKDVEVDLAATGGAGADGIFTGTVVYRDAGTLAGDASEVSILDKFGVHIGGFAPTAKGFDQYIGPQTKFIVEADADVLTVEGGLGDDALSGGDSADVISGDAGDDTISGGAEADTLKGGLGDDTIDGGTGIDTIDGESGNDTLTGDAGADIISGGLGADTIDGGADGDTIDGGDGADILKGGTGVDTITGGAGNDQLSAGDTINATEGGDSLSGGTGNDTYFLDDSWELATYTEAAGEGQDTLDFSAVSNTADTLTYTFSTTTLAIAQATAAKSLTALANFENIVTTNGTNAFVFADDATGTHHITGATGTTTIELADDITAYTITESSDGTLIISHATSGLYIIAENVSTLTSYDKLTDPMNIATLTDTKNGGGKWNGDFKTAVTVSTDAEATLLKDSFDNGVDVGNAQKAISQVIEQFALYALDNYDLPIGGLTLEELFTDGTTNLFTALDSALTTIQSGSYADLDSLITAVNAALPSYSGADWLTVSYEGQRADFSFNFEKIFTTSHKMALNLGSTGANVPLSTADGGGTSKIEISELGATTDTLDSYDLQSIDIAAEALFNTAFSIDLFASEFTFDEGSSAQVNVAINEAGLDFWGALKGDWTHDIGVHVKQGSFILDISSNRKFFAAADTDFIFTDAEISAGNGLFDKVDTNTLTSSGDLHLSLPLLYSANEASFRYGTDSSLIVKATMDNLGFNYDDQINPDFSMSGLLDFLVEEGKEAIVDLFSLIGDQLEGAVNVDIPLIGNLGNLTDFIAKGFDALANLLEGWWETETNKTTADRIQEYQNSGSGSESGSFWSIFQKVLNLGVDYLADNTDFFRSKSEQAARVTADATLDPNDYSRFSFGFGSGLELELKLVGGIYESVPIDVSTTVPGFSFDIEDGSNIDLEVEFRTDLKLGFFYNPTNGSKYLYLYVQDDDEIELNVSATISDGTALSAKLGGILDVGLTEQDKAVDGRNSGFFGHIGLDLSGGDGETVNLKRETSTLDWAATLSIYADFDLIGDIGAGSATAPSVSTIIHYEQNFVNMTYSKSSGFDFKLGGSPVLIFENVELDLGTFLTNVLGPFVDTFNDIMAPIRPFITGDAADPSDGFLEQEVAFLSGLGIIEDTLIPDGKVQMVEVLVTLAKLYDAKEGTKYANAISGIYKFFQAVDSLTVALESGSSGKISFGDFRIGGKSGTTNLTDKDAAKNAAEDPTKQADLNDKNAADSSGTTGSTAKDSKDAFDFDKRGVETTATFNVGFELPILEDPVTMFKLLTGQTADIIVLNVDALLRIEQYVGATFFGVINAGITFGAEMGLDLDIGVDTSGEVFVRDYADGTKPPVWVEVSTLLSVSVGIKGIVEAGIEGGLTGRVNFDFDDQLRENVLGEVDAAIDRIYLSDVHDPACLFNINGKVTAGADLFVKVNLPTPFGKITIYNERWNLFTATLFQFEFKCDPQQIAQFDTGTGELTLSTSGENSIDYSLKEVEGADGTKYIQVSNQYGNTIKDQNGNEIAVKAADLRKISFAGTSGNDSVFVDETIQNVDIDFSGGAGDDVFSIAGAQGTVSIDGGADNDIIIGADTGGTLSGGDGDDAIAGGLGIDIINGGDGTDTIDAGDSNDIIDGGDGDDTIYAGAGLDNITGGSGADTIYGGDGVDTINAGLGNDVITGGLGADIINAGLGDDLMRWSYGDGADDVNADEANVSEQDTIIITGDEDSGQMYSFARDLTDNSEIAFLANGQTMLLDGVEVIDFRAGTGADTINVGDLSGTGFENFVVNTGQTYSKDADGNHTNGYMDRSADVSADTVNIYGTNNDETFLVGNEVFDVDGDLNTTSDQKDAISVNVRQRNSADSYTLNIVDATDALDTLTINAGGGDDKIDASTYTTELSDLELKGDAGSDYIIGSDFADIIDGGADNDMDIPYRDKLLASTPNITPTAGLFGGGGADTIYGGSGHDFIMGEGGADQLIGGAGDDWVSGGAGVDTYFETSLTADADSASDIDTIFDVQDAHYYLTANRFVATDGTFTSSSQRENWDGSAVTGATDRQDENINGLFENVYLVGGASSNTFKLDGWADNAFLDGTAGGDSYIVELAQGGSGINLVQIDDSGTTGLDDLVYRGSALADTIQLDRIYKRDEDDGSWNGSYAADGKRYSADRWNGDVTIAGETYSFGEHKDGVLIAHFGSTFSGYDRKDLSALESADPSKVGTSTLDSLSNYQILNFNTMENVVVRGDEGADSFIIDDSPVGMKIYGDGGNDSFFTGSVIGTDSTIIEGQSVDVVTEYTNGVSNTSYLYGGDGADYFEVNHNAADLFMYGQNGDDLFYVKALLEYKDPLTKEAANLANAQSNINSGFDTTDADYNASEDQTELDADALVYVQNANINIDGGSGFDTLVLVGTALSDDFYIFNDNGQQKIYGAGIKLDSLTNVENVALITGAGDDNIYVYGVDLGGSGALRIVTGSGSDNVYFGGEEITTTISTPESYITSYRYLNTLYQKGNTEVVTSGDNFFGFSFDFIDFDGTTELLPMTLTIPAYDENLTIAASKDLYNAIVSPILIDAGVGISDSVIFNNELGTAWAAMSQRNVVTRTFTEDNSKIGGFSLLAGGTTSTQTDLLQLEGATNDIVTSFIKERGIYLDRFVDDQLLTDLQTQAGSIDIPMGTIYRTFETTTANNVTTSGWEALQNFAGTGTATATTYKGQAAQQVIGNNGYTLVYTETAHPDPSRTDIFIEVLAVKKGANELAFDAVFDSITVTDVHGVDSVVNNLNSLSLVAGDDLSVALSAGYVTPATITDVSSEAFNTMNFAPDEATLNSTTPSIHFNNFEEVETKLSLNVQNNFEINNTQHSGLTTVTGGNLTDNITLTTSGATTVLEGGAGDDVFTVADSTAIGGELFIFGNKEGLASEAGDSISINGDESSYSFDQGAYDHNESESRNFNLDDVLSIDQLIASESLTTQSSLEANALSFSQLVRGLSSGDLNSLWDQYFGESGSTLNSSLGNFTTLFASGYTDVQSQEGARFENEATIFLDALRETYNSYITNATWYEVSNNIANSHTFYETQVVNGETTGYSDNLCAQWVYLGQKRSALTARGVDASNLLSELLTGMNGATVTYSNPTTQAQRDQNSLDRHNHQQDFINSMTSQASSYLSERNSNWTDYRSLISIGKSLYGFSDADFSALGLSVATSKFSAAVIEGGTSYVNATWDHASVRYLADNAFDTLLAQQRLDYEADLANSASSDSMISAVWSAYNDVVAKVSALQTGLTNHAAGSITDTQLKTLAQNLETSITSASASNNSDELYQSRFKAMLSGLETDLDLTTFISELTQVISDKATLAGLSLATVNAFADVDTEFNNAASDYHKLRTIITNVEALVSKLQAPDAVSGYQNFADASIAATALDAFMDQLGQIGGANDVLTVFQNSYGSALGTVQTYLKDLNFRDKLVEIEELELELAALEANQTSLEALYGTLNDNELSAANALKTKFENHGVTQPSTVTFKFTWLGKTITLFSYTPFSYEYELAEARKDDAIALYNLAEAKHEEVMLKVRKLTGIAAQDLPLSISDVTSLIATKKAAIQADLTAYDNAKATLDGLSIYARFISSEVKDIASAWTDTELNTRLNAGTKRSGTITAYTNNYTSNSASGTLDVLSVNGSSGSKINIDANFTGTINVNGGTSAQQITLDGSNMNGDLVLNLGGGADRVLIKDTVQGSVTVNTGAGVDQVIVGNDSNTLDDIISNVNVDLGGDAGDLLQVNDTGDATGRTGTLSDTQITGLGMTGTITYANADTLDLNLGSAADDLTISNTSAPTTDVDTGNGSNTVNVTGSANDLNIVGGTDADEFFVTGSGAGSTVDITAGQGLDHISFGSLDPVNTAGALSAIAGAVTYDAGAEAGETINFFDNANTAATNLSLTQNQLTGFSAGGSVTYSNTEDLNMTLGSGVDNLTVESTHAGTTDITTGAGADNVRIKTISGDTTLDTEAGIDTVTVATDANTLDGIQANLDITGGADADTVNLNDTGDATVNTGALSSTALTGFGVKAGAAITYTTETLNVNLGSNQDNLTVNSTHTGATIINSNAGTDAVSINDASGTTTLNTGADVDTVTVAGLHTADATGNTTINTGDANDIVNVEAATQATLNINTENNDDVVTIGSDNTLNDIDATVNVDTGLGTADVIEINDTAETLVDAGTLTNAALTGFGLASVVNYTNAETLNLKTGSNEDTLTVESIHAGATNIESNAGNDTVNLTNSGSVDGLVGTLSVDLGVAGTDTLNIDDSANATAKTASLTSTQLTGLATGDMTYSNVEDLNLDLGTNADNLTVESTHAGTTDITTGAGADIVRIKTITGDTTLDTEAGIDTITVATNANTLDGIQANLDIVGGADADTVNLNDTGDATVNTGALSSTALTGFGVKAGSAITYTTETLNVNLGSNQDNLTVNSTHTGATVINSNAGTDAVSINDASGTTTLNTGADVDTVTVAGLHTADATGNTTINTGDANDIVNVEAATQGTLNVNTENNDDVVTIGSDNTLNDIDATVNVDTGLGTADVIEINDTAETLVDAGTLTNAALTGFGLAQAVNYSNAETLNLKTGSNQDRLTVESIHAGATNIESNAGNDTVNLTNSGSVDGLVGTLSVDLGAAGTDTLNIDDSANATAKTASLTSTQLTGLATGDITYSNAEDLNLDLGTNADDLTVESTHAGTTAITTGAGADNVRIKTITGDTTLDTEAGIDTITVATDANTLDGIQANLDITGGADADTVNLNDTGDATVNTGALSSTALTGFGVKAGSAITYTTETLNVNLGSNQDNLTVNSTHAGTTVINTNAGADAVRINDASGTTTLNTGADVDTVTVAGLHTADTTGNTTINTGDANDIVDVEAATQGMLNVNTENNDDVVTIGSDNTLNDIDATVNVDTGLGTADVIEINDTAETLVDAGTLTNAALTGFGLAQAVNYSNAETLNLKTGSNEDTLTVESIHAGATNIESNAGNDTVNLTNSGSVDGLVGTLSVDLGVAGTDTLNIDDSANATAKTASLTSTQLTGLATGDMTYSNVEDLNLDLGTNADDLTVESTHAGTTDITTGAGADIVRIKTIAGDTTLDTEAGDDQITLGNDSNSLAGLQANLDINGNADTTGDSLTALAQGTGSLTPTEIQGFGLNAANTLSYSNIEDLTVELHGATNDLTINDTHTGTVTVTGSANADTVTVNEANASDLTINTGLATDTVTVNNNHATTTTIDTDAGVDDINIVNNDSATTINAGSEADSIDVNATNESIVINGEAGDDAVVIANAGLLDDINAAVTFNGGLGLDTLTLDQSNTAVDQVVVTTNATTTVNTHTFNYADLETLNLNLGSGADTVDLQSTDADYNLNTGAGNDTVSTADAGLLENLVGRVSLDASTGYNLLNIDDSGDVDTGRIGEGKITGFGLGSEVTYSNFTFIDITLDPSDENTYVTDHVTIYGEFGNNDLIQEAADKTGVYVVNLPESSDPNVDRYIIEWGDGLTTVMDANGNASGEYINEADGAYLLAERENGHFGLVGHRFQQPTTGVTLKYVMTDGSIVNQGSLTRVQDDLFLGDDPKYLSQDHFATIDMNFNSQDVFDQIGSVRNSTVRWDFGNGDTMTGHNIDYAYPQTGVYQITMTVFDEDGEVLVRRFEIEVFNNTPVIVDITIPDSDTEETTTSFTVPESPTQANNEETVVETTSTESGSLAQQAFDFTNFNDVTSPYQQDLSNVDLGANTQSDNAEFFVVSEEEVNEAINEALGNSASEEASDSVIGETEQTEEEIAAEVADETVTESAEEASVPESSNTQESSGSVNAEGEQAEVESSVETELSDEENTTPDEENSEEENEVAEESNSEETTDSVIGETEQSEAEAQAEDEEEEDDEDEDEEDGNEEESTEGDESEDALEEASISEEGTDTLDSQSADENSDDEETEDEETEDEETESTETVTVAKTGLRRLLASVMSVF